MKITAFFLAFCLACSLPTLAQRGKIIKPATTSVMDPDLDGFISISPTGFSDKGFNGYYVKEFEIPMFGIPIVGDGEAFADNQVGPSCGISDITVDSLGFGAYAVLDDADNLIFRFRIGTNNPSVESYSILIDTDGKIGTDDLNSTPDNPGFEIDITLIKNHNKGVYIYNIDGIENCPTPLRNYSFDSHFQISIGDIISCSDPDFFYDYYIPFNDLQTLFGLQKASELRFVALTNISGTCAMAGKISDVGGVDDADYDGCNSCAFLDLVTNQCPTALTELCSNCPGFQTGVTPKPFIDTPVKAGENAVSGTAVPASTVFVDLFNSSNVLKESVTTQTAASGCTACPWVAAFTSTLSFGDIISAKAKSTTGCQSGGISSDATVTIVVNNIPPVISGTIGTLNYSENDPPLKIDGTLVLSDADDNNLDEALVSISANFISSEDVLSFNAVAGISGTFNPSTGTLQFTGVAPLSAYLDLLKSVAYSNTSENPSTATRTITIVVNDGLDDSNLYSRQITVSQVNDPPVANDDNGSTNEDNPVTLPNVTANDTDVDGTVDPATVDLDPLTAGKQVTLTDGQGTWSVDLAGAITFTPVLNFNGIATKAYQVNDNLGAVSNSGFLSVTVVSVNDAPIAIADNGATNEESPITLANVTANDFDVDGTIDASTVDLDPGTVGIQTTFTNAQGGWSTSPAGSVTFTPAINFTGVATRTYTVNDNSGTPSNAATISITVNPVNDPPVANDDSGVTNENTPITIPNVTSNDTDADGTINVATVDLDPVTAGLQTDFTNSQGNWSVDAGGAVTYTPTTNFNGVATKTYSVNDNLGTISNSATITITVNPVNNAPVANDDSGSTPVNTPLTLGITENDTDVDGTVNPATVDLDPSTVGQQTSFVAVQGTWNVNGLGNLTLTPAVGFTGIATVNYTVSDNLGLPSNQAIVSINVSGILASAPPVANNDAGTTDEDTPVILPNITANDTDPDGTVDPSTVDLDPLTTGKQATLSNANGSWSVDALGAVTFTPALNISGVITKNYTVNDNTGTTSNSATITITINALNDPPLAVNDTGGTNEETPATLFNITSNDIDVDGTVDVNTIDLDSGTGGIQNSATTSQGSWAVNPTGDITFTPASNFIGLASLAYTVKDNLGAISNAASISINVTSLNDSPIAFDDSATTLEDTPLTSFTILANDSDADGTLNASTVDIDLQTPGIQNTINASHGTWSFSPVSGLTFTPALDFVGIVTINYFLKDNAGASSNSATITITVIAVNDPPVAHDASSDTDEDQPLTLVGVVANDTDVDGTVDGNTVDLDPLTGGIQPAVTRTEGNWSVNSTGDVTFNPSLNFNGIGSIQYVVADNLGAFSNAAVISITVNPINDIPVLIDVSDSTFRNMAVSGNVIDPLDHDPDGSVLAVTTTPLNGPSNGSILVSSNGDFTYTPALDFDGIDMVEIEFCDNGIPLPAACASKVLTLKVKPVNRPPVLLINAVPGDSLSVITLEDTPVVFCFEALDPDNDDVTIKSFTNIVGGGALSSYGGIDFCMQFTPAKDFNGTSVWEAEVCDNGSPALCGYLTVTIDIIPVNDPPVAVIDSIRVLRNEMSGGNILANDFDIENDVITLNLTPVTDVQHGQAILQADGNLSYISDITFRGIDSLRYQICDSGIPSGCSEGKVVILVEDLPLKVYEGVTPNGDGNNDYLRIDGIDFYTTNEVSIFDRYNNLVFQQPGYDNEEKVWRGQSNRGVGRSELPEGTYFYTINLGDDGPLLKGFVYLKRNQ